MSKINQVNMLYITWLGSENSNPLSMLKRLINLQTDWFKHNIIHVLHTQISCMQSRCISTLRSGIENDTCLVTS